MFAAHELGIEIELQRRVLVVQVGEGCAPFLKHLLVALHGLSRSSDSVENFGRHQRLRRPFIEWRSIMRLFQGPVVEGRRREHFILLSFCSSERRGHVGFGEPGLRPVGVAKGSECFLIRADRQRLLRFSFQFCEILFFLEGSTLGSISTLAR